MIIYGETGITDKIAIRIKGQICENAKMLSYVNVIPEMNHNEIVGWENNPQIFDNLFVLHDDHSLLSESLPLSKVPAAGTDAPV